MGGPGSGRTEAGTCRNGHLLTCWEPIGCEGIGCDHRLYVCKVRRGARPCGDVIVLPPFSAACSGLPER